MNQPLTRVITTVIVACSLLIPLAARAELIAQEQSAEANQVRILFTKGTEQGMAQVKECESCPFNLDINDQTRFFHNGKEIERRKVESHSGKPATVIYSKDGKQALRILW